MGMDVVDYKVYGAEMQFVEIELDPAEAAVGEAGSMFYMEDGITMETIFGDGSAQQSGFFGKLVGAGKRVLAGDSFFVTLFGNSGARRADVAFAAPYPGKIVPIDLAKIGGTFICQKDAFLCAAKGVALGIAFQKKLGAGFFGGEGFIMQKLDGDGMAFLHAGGTMHQRNLKPGEVLRVDTGCLVGLQTSVDYDIEYVGGIKTAIFGGEGLFLATLTGPGKVVLQSMTLQKMRRELAPMRRGGDEHSPLGALGGFLGGSED